MKRLIYAMLGLMCCVCMTGCGGCYGTVVPPGKIVIVLHANDEPSIVEEGVYKAWGRDRVYFIDRKLKSFNEDLQILCEDDINMSIEVKTIMSFDAAPEQIDFIRDKVPAKPVQQGEDTTGFELSLDQFYEMTVKDIVRGTARNIVNKYKTDDIRPNREQIESDLSEAVRTRIKTLNYPLSISAVLLSNIDYPDTVKAQREEIKRAQLEDQRLAALADAERAEQARQAAVETEKAKVRLIKAQAQADENEILTASLTPQFLTWRQLEVMENVSTEMAKGQNNVVFIMPYNTIDQNTLNTAMIREALKPKEPSTAKAQ